MNIAIVSLLPAIFDGLNHGVVGRYIVNDKVKIEHFNPRDFTKDLHRTVDDKPYGGGPGMLMSCEPLDDAIEAARAWLVEQNNSSMPLVVLMSPQGETLNHLMLIERFTELNNVIIICGRYEGIDERLIQLQVDCEISVGDFVVSGGEIPCMLLIDALVRQLPDALGNNESAVADSFASNQLKYPQYTRPEVYKGLQVPSVLLSGDHAKIEQWRQQQSLQRTAARRPDLIK